MGACENINTGSLRCVMQKEECVPSHLDGQINPVGEVWFSGYALKLRGDEPCKCEETPVGECSFNLSPSNICAPKELGYCNSVETFKASDEIDSCECDSTMYGACQDFNDESNHFCAYSYDDCEAEYNHVWVEPRRVKEVTGLDCSCQNVRIGGCVGGFSSFHCAVTPEECVYDRYYPPLSLKIEHGESCYMCETSTTNNREPNPDEIDTITQSKKTLSTGGKVGIGVSVSLVTSFFIGAGYIFYKRRRRRASNFI